MSEEKKRIFGIDLGTTNSSIAYVDEYGKPVIVPNAENQRITPSVVFFDEDSIVIGEVAKESAKLYPDGVVSFIKRSMGEANFLFEHDAKTYRAEEIASFILRKVVQDAEQNLGEKITDVVITCPAYFGINEREATRKAGEIAGLNVRQIINEPTAAAIAYGALEEGKNQVVLVYDLGGGTFDITMIEIKSDAIEVICTGGDHNLGGKDWDDRIVYNLVQEFQTQTGKEDSILEDPDTYQDLQNSAERAKKTLSQRTRTPVLITHGGERIKVEFGRDKFEEIAKDLLERTIGLTKDMLEEAKKKGYDKFDEIVLVGGSIRMPEVAERIRKEFAVNPKTFDPDEAVAKGAAIYGWQLLVNDGIKKRIAEKTHKPIDQMDEQIDLNSNQVQEAVKEAAAEEGYTLPAYERAFVKVKNVTSKSFGVVVKNVDQEELAYNIIMKNTPVPTEYTHRFYTAVEGQKTVLIQIMETETSELTISSSQGIEIGKAVLDLPDNLPDDSPVDIEFRLNEEGRLEMTAVEQSESQQKIKVTIDTSCVIQGEELEEAKTRCQALVVH